MPRLECRISHCPGNDYESCQERKVVDTGDATDVRTRGQVMDSLTSAFGFRPATILLTTGSLGHIIRTASLDRRKSRGRQRWRIYERVRPFSTGEPALGVRGFARETITLIDPI